MGKREKKRKEAASAVVNPAKKKVVVPTTPEDAAAMVIQEFWARLGWKTTHHLVCNLIDKINLTTEHVKSISFEALVVMLRKKPVIQAAKSALQRIHLLATFRHGSPSKSLAPENVNVRVFLAAYMIAIRPTHVFESMAPLEQALFESSVPMLHQFHAICNTLKSSPLPHFQYVPSDQTKEFPTALFEFLKRFKAWKVPDEAKLTCRIKHALVALYQAEQHLPPDEPEDSKLKIEFRTQILRLRDKLRQIAGVEAVIALDSTIASGQIGAGAPPGAAGEGYAALPGRMTNEQLAHELLLDGTFQLHESGNIENPVFHRIRESFHQAFWLSLIDDLKLATPCYVRVLRVLKEIHDAIVDLAGNREEGSIGEVINVDYIKDTVEKGAYSVQDAKNLLRGTYSVILCVQAAKRDAETKEKWGVVELELEQGEWAPALCHGLEFLLDRVNAMRIDAANARLRLIAPVIKDHGIDYERGKFADKVHDGTVTPERTMLWLAGALDTVADFSGRLSDTDRSVSAKAAIELHTRAMVSLVTGAEGVTLQTIPETLAFDLARIEDFRGEFNFIVAAKTILVILARPTRCVAVVNPVSALVQKMEVDATPAVVRAEAQRGGAVRAQKGLEILGQLQRCEDISVSLFFGPERDPAFDFGPDPRFAKELQACVESNLVPKGPVRELFRSRLQKYICGRITGEEKEHNPLSLPSPLLERAEALIKKVGGVARLNREVHAPFYNNIFAHIANHGKVGLDRLARESFPPRAGRA